MLCCLAADQHRPVSLIVDIVLSSFFTLRWEVLSHPTLDPDARHVWIESERLVIASQLLPVRIGYAALEDLTPPGPAALFTQRSPDLPDLMSWSPSSKLKQFPLSGFPISFTTKGTRYRVPPNSFELLTYSITAEPVVFLFC